MKVGAIAFMAMYFICARIKLAALAFLTFISCTVLAEEFEVYGEFRALYANTRGSFDNRTPITHCYSLIEIYCQKDNLITSRISFYSDGVQPAGSELFISLPAMGKTVEVIHEDGITSKAVTARLQAVGGKVSYKLRSGESIEKNIDTYWAGGNFARNISPCTSRESPVYGAEAFAFYWRLSSNVSECKKASIRSIESLKIEDVFFVLNTVTPDPLRMKPGIYNGKIRFSVGTSGSDIVLRFGNGGGRVTDSELVFNYTLKVEPFFRFEVPAGGNKVELAPQEGWQRWLQQGRAPSRLWKNQTFNIWSNERFTMRLECSVRLGDDCGLKGDGPSGHLVPLKVAVTLPENFADQSGNRVINRGLSLDSRNSGIFAPDAYLERIPGSLQFEVQKDAVDEMLKFPGSLYRGTVTVVWESVF